MKQRLVNAGCLFVIVGIISGLAWLLSMALYAIGLWPLGAIVRFLIWAFVLYGLYWVIRHLVESEETRIRKDLERMRRTGLL